jgi:hypothetical protein
VLAIEPEDEDRLAAFMAFRWLSALQESRWPARLHRRPGRRSGTRNGGKRLMHSAVATIPAGFQPRVPEEIRRIAVVVPYVGHQFHTPSMMAVEQCAVLAREGCQVRIFSAQELTPPDAAQFRGDGRDLKLPPLNAQVWGKLLPAGVDMTISDSRFSLPGRWRKLMPVLAGSIPMQCCWWGFSLRWPPPCTRCARWWGSASIACRRSLRSMSGSCADPQGKRHGGLGRSVSAARAGVSPLEAQALDERQWPVTRADLRPGRQRRGLDHRRFPPGT